MHNINEALLAKAIDQFLTALGLDTKDQHFRDTPKRVAKAWKHTFASGYEIDPASFLKVEFNDNFDQMIVVKDIPFISHCAHHMVPFVGTAKIGYIPDKGRITGLSKLARVVQGYARRLQIQEQLTRQIATAIQDVLKPRGVGVVLTAEHMCMTQRGAQAVGSKTVTSYLTGCFRNEPATRAEFMGF